MPTVKTLTSNLNYETVSSYTVSDENTILFFLHEALGSIPQFKDFPQQLCDALEINGLVYEREGYGNSELISSTNSIFSVPRTADYLSNYALEELPQVIDALAPNKQLILVGHSDGGSIALLYAKRFPERIKAVITMAAHVINEEVTRAGIYQAIKAFENGKLKGLERYHKAKTTKLFYAWANTWLHKDYIHWNIKDQISQQQRKGLIIQGKEDQYGTEKQVNLIVNSFDNNLGVKLMLENCGHAPHLEKTKIVINNIKHFIKSI